MANDNHVTKRATWANLFAPLGLMLVMVAGFAFIVAGVFSADTFGGGMAPNQLARHHGVVASVGAWAMPLALSGIAMLFSAIAVALTRVGISIRGRRDALVHALPRVLQSTH